MRLWRIATKTRTYAADDLSGGGSAKSPGRWNDNNEPVIYCAPSVAMAVLETAAHIDDAGLPSNRFLIQIDVPDDVWSQREEADLATLPATWNAIPAGRSSAQFGSRWLIARRSPILLVPSVIVPEEQCALINPKHPAAATITASVIRAYEYNKLFRS